MTFVIYLFIFVLVFTALTQFIEYFFSKANSFVLRKPNDSVFPDDAEPGKFPYIGEEDSDMYYLGSMRFKGGKSQLMYERRPLGQAIFRPALFRGVSKYIWGSLARRADDEDKYDYTYYGFLTKDAKIYVRRSGDKENIYVGFLALPTSAKNTDEPIPSLRGKRHWYELWLVRHLDVYYGPYPSTAAVKDKDKKKNKKDNESGSSADEPADSGKKCSPQSVLNIVESVRQYAEERGDTETTPMKAYRVGKVSLTGITTSHISHGNADKWDTLEARAGLITLLYYLFGEDEDEIPEENALSPDSWRDTALLASLVYTVIFVVFYFLQFGLIDMPFLGKQWSFVLVNIGFYYLVWALVRYYKIYRQAIAGRPMKRWLFLFNKAVGLDLTRLLIIICGALTILFTFFHYTTDFIPMVVAILIGVVVNGTIPYTRRPWTVLEKFTLHIGHIPEERTEESETETRTYDWDLDSYNNQNKLHGHIELKFDPDYIKMLRYDNPSVHLNDGTMTHERCFQNLWDYMKNDPLTLRHLNMIAKYIKDTTSQARLPWIDTIQFVLDFVQEPNIVYKTDEDCEEITSLPSNPKEYIRFPDETLFDKRGDCDCKSFLAACLFSVMHVPVIIALSETEGHAAIGVYCDESWTTANANGSADLSRDTLLTYNGKKYYYCETTGDNFKVGDFLMAEGKSIGDFTKFVELS